MSSIATLTMINNYISTSQTLGNHAYFFFFYKYHMRIAVPEAGTKGKDN